MPLQSNQQVLQDIEVALRYLARHREEYDWIDLSKLSARFRLLKRPLYLPAVRAERQVLQKELRSFFSRAQGAWRYLHPREVVPECLFYGASGSGGRRDDRLVFARFFTEMTRYPELREMMEQDDTGQSWNDRRQTHRRWRLLSAREDDYRERLPVALVELRRMRRMLEGRV